MQRFAYFSRAVHRKHSLFILVPAFLWRNQSTLMPIPDFQTIMFPLLKYCEDGRKCYCFIFFCTLMINGLFSNNLRAQTVIGGDTIDQSAMLDIQAVNKGVLLPRLTTEQRNTIIQPAFGLLVFNITLQCVEINLGNPDTPNWRCLAITPTGTVGNLNCEGKLQRGILMPSQPANSTSFSIPYSSGNGAAYPEQTVMSSEISGLKATLSPGNLNYGSGYLDWTISGIPDKKGVAVFTVGIGDKLCTIKVGVGCGAFIAPGKWKEFMCYNLGVANPSANPFIPSWEINGGYWQWGRNVMAATGPTGPSESQGNYGGVSDWNENSAPSTSWSEVSKGPNDPCPSGFRLPSNKEWEDILIHNEKQIIGNSSLEPANYSNGLFLGNNLFLPAANGRASGDGGQGGHGRYINYWSSSVFEDSMAGGVLYAELRQFNSDGLKIPLQIMTTNTLKTGGYSIRCIAE